MVKIDWSSAQVLPSDERRAFTLRVGLEGDVDEHFTAAFGEEVERTIRSPTRVALAGTDLEWTPVDTHDVSGQRSLIDDLVTKVSQHAEPHRAQRVKMEREREQARLQREAEAASLTLEFRYR